MKQMGGVIQALYDKVSAMSAAGTDKRLRVCLREVNRPIAVCSCFQTSHFQEQLPTSQLRRHWKVSRHELGTLVGTVS